MKHRKRELLEKSTIAGIWYEEKNQKGIESRNEGIFQGEG